MSVPFSQRSETHLPSSWGAPCCSKREPALQQPWAPQPEGEKGIVTGVRRKVWGSGAWLRFWMPPHACVGTSAQHKPWPVVPDRFQMPQTALLCLRHTVILRRPLFTIPHGYLLLTLWCFTLSDSTHFKLSSWMISSKAVLHQLSPEWRVRWWPSFLT